MLKRTALLQRNEVGPIVLAVVVSTMSAVVVLAMPSLLQMYLLQRHHL